MVTPKELVLKWVPPVWRILERLQLDHHLVFVASNPDHGEIPSRPVSEAPAGDRPAMRHALVTFSLMLSFAASFLKAAPPDLVATTDARTPAEEKALFHLPEGFVAELIASEPEIHKPLNIAFDDKGRLWVTDTLEYPFPVLDGRKPRDGVKILSDFAPDGHARKIQTFATGLNIPIGLLPMPGGNEALVHGIPNIYRITDNDGDGTSDQKEVVYRKYGFRDTHGMTNSFTWGFDGWIYACHGYSNDSTVQGEDGKAITMQSGNTYRMKADGNHLEYFTHGQVNPFGLCFDPLGNLYSSDCHSRPIYQLLRGAYYPSFGKPDDGLGFGPEMCFHEHGSTGIAGIVYYAADHFPKPYHDRIFIGNPVTSRINQDTIAWTGSTPKAVEQPDFLVSDDPWFRPVDLKLGPDGALYVADFYNKIIGHYEVPLTHPGRDRERGRIWRIVYRGKDGKGTLPDADAFTKRTNLENLGSLNPTVRTFATNQLARRSTTDAASLREIRTTAQEGETNRRVQALWVMHRRGAFFSAGNDRLPTLEKAIGDPDRAIRVHAQKILGESHFSGYFQQFARDGLKDPDVFVRRAAAETLGRHPDSGNVKPLLALRTSALTGDTHLVHVVRMALRDQFLEDSAWEKLEALKPSDTELDAIADVAPGVHTASSARWLLTYMENDRGNSGDLNRFVTHVARYGETGAELRLLKVLKGIPNQALLAKTGTLKAYQQGLQTRGVALNAESKAYAESLASSLLDGSPQERAAGLNLIGTLKLGGLNGKLAAVAANEKTGEGERVEALSALESLDPTAAEPILAGVLANSAAPVGLRERVAGMLGAGGRKAGIEALAAALPTAPSRLQSAIAAALVVRKEGAEALLNALSEGKASARLLQEPRVFGPLGNSGIPKLAERLVILQKGLPPADARVNALIATRRAGFGMAKAEAAAGAKLFETNCGNCHMLGGKGGRVGPQLDGIGVRGADRLLEDMLDPSRNVDQTFRLTTIASKDGQVVSGLLLREEGEVIVIADAQGKEVRLAKNAVEERTMAPVSPMPANFAEQISEADFYKLLAFLLTQRPKQ